MAFWEQIWSPFGVSFDITVEASNVQRTSSSTFTCDIYAKWRGHWSNTNYGMKVTAGGKEIGIPYYDTKNHREGEGTLYGCSFSVSSTNATNVSIYATFTNYKTDVKPAPSASYNFWVEVSVPKYVGPGGSPSLTITDLGGYKARLSGTLGVDGTNNKLDYSTVYYTTNGNLPSHPSNYTYYISLGDVSGGSYSKDIDLPTNCVCVKAITYCTFKSGTTHSGNKSKTITYYLPEAPGTPEISYTKSRLTIKEPWTFTWDEAKAGNTNSPIKGYRFRLYRTPKDGTKYLITGLTVGTGDTIVPGTGTLEYLDRESASCTAIINPTDFGFEPGDKVQLGIYSYTTWPTTDPQKFNDNGDGTAQVLSDDYLIENAGVTRVKVDDKWEEGIVYVKADDKWVEADLVYTKADDKWQESE